MQYSKRGLQLTESFEGCRYVAYQDVRGVWTIGYGHTKGVEPGDVCTHAQAEAWLDEDTATAEVAVNRLVKVPLTQNEFDALVDFAFNCGVGALQGSTLLRLLNAGDDAKAAEEFERWTHAGGEVVAGLLRRRGAERDLFKQPDAGAAS